MSKTTRATDQLKKSGVAFSIHTYDYDPNADRIGLQAAEALGESAERVLKTLMALVDVVAGYSISILTARRDMTFGEKE